MVATAVGIGLGIAADFAVGAPLESMPPILATLLLWPVAVTVAGAATPLEALRPALLVGGILFPPVYGLLTWKWLTSGHRWALVALGAWTAQGFFQLLHRVEVLLSAT